MVITITELSLPENRSISSYYHLNETPQRPSGVALEMLRLKEEVRRILPKFRCELYNNIPTI